MISFKLQTVLNFIISFKLQTVFAFYNFFQTQAHSHLSMTFYIQLYTRLNSHVDAHTLCTELFLPQQFKTKSPDFLLVLA